jgi:hypothetical protein
MDNGIALETVKVYAAFTAADSYCIAELPIFACFI